VKRCPCMILLLLLAAGASAFGSDTGPLKLQGPIMSLDAKTRVITVNERDFVCTPQTEIYNEKGLPITFDKLKPRGWVYIEAVRQGASRNHPASKIYTIPGYVHDKEKYRYSFMQ
jgi:hypothetical protein